jgi:hypothetical protein
MEAAKDFPMEIIFKDIQIGQKGVWKPIQTGVIMSATSVLCLCEELKLASGTC